MAATTEEVPRPYGRGTSSVVSFVVAMNRVDVVDLVVDLVDVNLDIDLVDVDLDVDLVDVGLVDVVPAVFSVFGFFGPGCICAKNTRGRKGTLGKRGLTNKFHTLLDPTGFWIKHNKRVVLSQGYPDWCIKWTCWT